MSLASVGALRRSLSICHLWALFRSAGPLPALGVEDQVQVGGPRSKAPSKKRPPKPKPPEASSEPLPSPTLDGSPRSQVRSVRLSLQVYEGDYV